MNRSDMPEDIRDVRNSMNLTIRETFILHAMQGLLSNSVMGDCALHDSPEEWVDDITDSAIVFADAQIKKMGKCND